MAATVEGALVLIDRASPGVARVRRELAMVRGDAQHSGAALDHMSGPASARRLDTLAQETRGLGQDVRHTERQVDHAERDAARLERRAVGLGRGTQRARLKLGALRSVLGLLKWPALIAGVGGALQAVGGLTAGAVALLPKLLDLAGAAASGGVLLAGVGAAVGTAKLATAGLAPALAGNAAALKRLTPQGRAFVAILRSYRPELDRLRETAQRGLFPGLGALLGDVRAQAPGLRSVVRRASSDLGGLARFAGRQIAAPGATRDLARVADEGSRALGAAARSGFYLAHALEQVLIAAGPLTDWLGNAVERLARSTDAEAQAARESGGLDAMFTRTEASVRRLAGVGAHAFGGLRGLMGAARGQSDSLWSAIDESARRFDRWSNSVTGQSSLRRWFDETRPALSAAVGLVGDVGKAIASLTRGPEGAAMLNSLRRAMPSLAGGVHSLTASLGPALLDALGSSARLLGDLAGNAGPLTLVANSIGMAASVVDGIVRATGSFAPALMLGLVGGAALRKSGLLSMPVVIFGGGHGRGRVAGGAEAEAEAEAEARAAAATESEATVVAASGGAVLLRRPGITRLPAVATASEAPMLRAAVELGPGEVMTASGIVLPPGVRSVDPLELAQASPAALATEAEPLGLLARARGMAGAAGRFLGPVALISGLMGAMGTKGGIGARLQGALSGATLGIVPAPETDDERTAKDGAAARDVIAALPDGQSVGAQRSAIAQLTHELRAERALVARLSGGPFAHAMNDQVRASTAALAAELHRRQRVLAETLRAQRQQVVAASVAHGSRLAEDLGRAFEIRAHAVGPVAAMHKTAELVLNATRAMHPAGAKVLDENMLSWARQQARGNPRVLLEVKRLEDRIRSTWSDLGRHVEIVNGRVLMGSTAEWTGIRRALATQTEQAREDVSADFTAIQQQAAGSLEAMGFSRSDARSMIASIEHGAKAGRVAASDASQGPTGAGQRPSVNSRNLARAHGYGDGFGRPKHATGGRVAAAAASFAGPVAGLALTQAAASTGPRLHVAPPTWPAHVALRPELALTSRPARAAARAAGISHSVPATVAVDLHASLSQPAFAPASFAQPTAPPAWAPHWPASASGLDHTAVAWPSLLTPSAPPDVAPSRPGMSLGNSAGVPIRPRFASSSDRPMSETDRSAEHKAWLRRAFRKHFEKLADGIADGLDVDRSAVHVDPSQITIQVGDEPPVPLAA